MGAGLPPWLDPLPDAEQMRAVDRWAIDQRGVPSLDLMERAAEGLADVVTRQADRDPVAVVCGKGNNGGDGLAAARLLRERGHEVAVLLLAKPDEYEGDAAANLERLPGTAPEPFDPGALSGATVIVDAMLGTGFSGAPRDPVAGAIEAINAAAVPVVAADVPSGVDASTGRVEGKAVRATGTATFHAAKPGLYVVPGKQQAGEVTVVDIGIPAGAPVEARAGLIDGSVLDDVPRRHRGSTKFSEGAVLVVGGSAGLTGAPCLAGEAAARAGAGYVTAAIPSSLAMVFEVRLLEAMTRALPDRAGALSPNALEPALESAARADAVVLGPGAGSDEGTVTFVRELAERCGQPLLLDADGLNAHAGALDALATRDAPTVLTPHAGELGRLLGCDSADVQADRLGCARAAARQADAVVVLKGDDTLVAQPNGAVAVSAAGFAALATAGTGDVLSGAIGAMLAKGLPAFHAACAGVHLHALAGGLAGQERGPDGVIARDVIEALPHARVRVSAR